ncbi:MAG: hypothetical protein WA954_03720 [Parerythrobacter sp.]
MRFNTVLKTSGVALLAMPIAASAQPVANAPPPAPDAMPPQVEEPMEDQAQTTDPVLSPEADAYAIALPPKRRALFMRLAAQDRARLIAMTEAEQAEAWQTIEAMVADETIRPDNPAAGPAPQGDSEPEEQTGDPD